MRVPVRYVAMNNCVVLVLVKISEFIDTGKDAYKEITA